MRTDDGQVLKLTDSFSAELYAVSSNNLSASRLARIITEHPLVESASTCMRHIQITNLTRSEVVRVTVGQAGLKKLVYDLEAFGGCTLYNVDLHPVQRYFLSRDLVDFGRCAVTCNEDHRVRELALTEPESAPQIEATTINLDSEETITKKRLEDPRFQIIAIRQEQMPALYLQLRRNCLLNGFSLRPLPGKLILEMQMLQTLGIAGLDEKSRFAGLPIGDVAMWGPARVIDSRQCYEAIKRSILIPRTRAGTAKNVLTAREVAYTDRGALILSPRVGLHENVAELDFNSLFPSIIVKHNISYETVSTNGIDHTRSGLLAEITERFVHRRRELRQRRNGLPEDSDAWRELDQREQVLKKHLVSLFGYSGSDLNRFGNVFAYREVNRIGRETVVAAMNVALREGFQVIYLDTDSIFVKRENTNLNDFVSLARMIESETGFDISLAHHYRYLVLLPQEADPEIEAARRFYGKLTDGRVYYRGIELRRHDYPPFLKKFQEKLLDIILEADDPSDILRARVREATAYTQETVEKVLSGHLETSELVVSKSLRMPVERYRSLFPHVLAAIQLRQHGQRVRPGDMVDFVYVDTEQVNPMSRVAAAKYAETYDADKYAEMTLGVAETILAAFSFSRTQLGFKHRQRNFLEELKGERGREILLELENLDPR
jgi:DNA polymerase elongation subunit (family B)